jgi:hypothetical protein
MELNLTLPDGEGIAPDGEGLAASIVVDGEFAMLARAYSCVHRLDSCMHVERKASDHAWTANLKAS